MVIAHITPPQATDAAGLVVAPPLVLRRADGRIGAEHVAIREWTGIPCRG